MGESAGAVEVRNEPCHLAAATVKGARAEELSATAHQLRENDRVVVLAVARSIQDRHRSLTRAAGQLVDLVGLGPELISVPRAKLVEALGIVAEPLPQLGARRKIACPLVQLRSRSGDAAWP